mgnify:CR=1 FL=1
MKKKFFIFFILIFVSGCGFTPLYNDNNKSNYNILITDQKGDQVLNNLIVEEIQRISNLNSSDNLYLKIDTKYEKKIISKDTKGSASEYELSVLTYFSISGLENNQKFLFKEKQNLKNISDTFEQKNYENIIKRNFASSLVRKLNLKILEQK